MTFVVSDIHGCYDEYKKLLERIHFRADDTLYVLGDVIDRGADGFKILLDMAGRANIITLMGNHEAMAIVALSYLSNTLQEGKTILDEENKEAVEIWFCNGGEVSFFDFLSLDKEQMQIVWNYMQKLPLYKEISLGGKQFILVHGGLDNFSTDRPMEDYTPDEILWCHTKPDTVYFQDKLLICGHTPTPLLYAESGKSIDQVQFFHGKTFIDIDCGCVFPRGCLGCLCLDTMEEIYIR